MLLTCLFKCSPRAKHLPHPSTSHRYILLVFPLFPFFFPMVVAKSSKEVTVGTLLPRDFFVRWGTGTGTGSELIARERRRPEELDVDVALDEPVSFPPVARVKNVREVEVDPGWSRRTRYVGRWLAAVVSLLEEPSNEVV